MSGATVPSRRRLLPGQAPDVVGGGFAAADAFVHVDGQHIERETRRAEQLGAARRGGCEHEAHAMLNDKIESMRPLSSAVPGALAELLRGAPLSPGKVTFAWRAAVGPAVERETAVRLEGTTLIVDAATRQWAQEVRRSSSTS